tara:strand:- start:880 stop:1146 length:267 start_codon:yes stop_codon:yes gene_type:complete
MMPEPNYKFLKVLAKEAFKCFAKGDTENAEAMLFSFMQTVDPTFADDVKKDRQIIYTMIKIKNTSKDPAEQFAATLILKFLKSKGVNL